MIEDNCYVYQIIRPQDLSVIYVGQGQDRRLKEQIRLLKSNKNPIQSLQEEYNKSVESGRELIFDVVEKHITKERALELEKELINKYGRLDLQKGTLYNRTDGGIGPTNPILSEKSIRSRKTVWLGRHHTDETKAKIGAFHKNKIVSQETRQKQSEVAKKRVMKDSTKEKLREIGFTRKQSNETKEKCRQNALKQWAARKALLSQNNGVDSNKNSPS